MTHPGAKTMSNRREITIGALRLIADEKPDGSMSVLSLNYTPHLFTATEWQSLLAVSALIEAAREWRETMDWSASRAHQEQFTCEVTLVDAIDALTATSSRGSK